MNLTKYREHLMALSYLAGGGLQPLGIFIHVLGLISIIGFGLYLRSRSHPEERFQFSFWQAIIWQATAFVVAFIGGFWNYSNAQSIITAIIIVISGLLVYITYVKENPPRIPVLHELAEIIIGKTNLR
jgi:cell division protein FtsW (lipid II flippase)